MSDEERKEGRKKEGNTNLTKGFHVISGGYLEGIILVLLKKFQNAIGSGLDSPRIFLHRALLDRKPKVSQICPLAIKGHHDVVRADIAGNKSLSMDVVESGKELLDTVA